MSTIKLHLERAEYNAIARFAESLHVTPEDIAFAALNRLMLVPDKSEIARDIVETHDWRRQNLPLWSDSAGSVHAYEGKPDDEPVRSRFV